MPAQSLKNCVFIFDFSIVLLAEIQKLNLTLVYSFFSSGRGIDNPEYRLL
jgi:hypothetical protein